MSPYDGNKMFRDGIVFVGRKVPKNADDNRASSDSCSSTTNSTCSENINSDLPSESIVSLVKPWLSIVAIACSCAIYYSVIQKNENNILISRDERQLLDTDDYNPALPPPHEGIHRPVYNENHKPLFPLTTPDYYGFALAVLGLMIAAGGGIGGGGILVPIYILVMGFSPKHAIPLSNITVLGGALANTMLNISKRHPLVDRPMIDWDLILVMEPLTVAGALIGAVLNKILPEVLLSVLLVILLSFTAWTTLKKAIKMFQKETKDIISARESELTKLERSIDTEVQVEARNQLLNEDENDEDEKKMSSISSPLLVDINADDSFDAYEAFELRKRHAHELATILEEERHIPSKNVIILSVMFAVVLSVNVLKGGGAFPSPFGITCGSTSFWFANSFLLGWIFVVMFFVRIYLVQRYHIKKECGYPYVPGDIQWDEGNTIKFPFICCFAGFFAGMFGIGGGIVKGPLMLAMGVQPAVGAASTAAMILFTAFAATTSFVVFGLLIYDYAFLLTIIGFISTLIGQIGLGYLMKKNGRNSYIAFSIGGVVLLSAILMTIQSIVSMAAGEKHHSGGVCGKGD